MQDCTFGKLDWQASALDFGAMGLPALDNDPRRIDEEKTMWMINYTVNQDVNCADTTSSTRR